MYINEKNFRELTFATPIGKNNILCGSSVNDYANMIEYALDQIKKLIDSTNRVYINIKNFTTMQYLYRIIGDLYEAYNGLLIFAPSLYADKYGNIRGFSMHDCGFDKFKNLITFFTNLYQIYLYSQKNYDNDSKQLYYLFVLTRNTISNLGIKSVDPDMYYNFLNYNNNYFEFNTQIYIKDNDEFLSKNCPIIEQLPYYMDFPILDESGFFKRNSDKTLIYQKQYITYGKVWMDSKTYDNFQNGRRRILVK